MTGRPAAELAESGPPAGGKVIDHPKRVQAAQSGDLAARMVSVACELACLVRDEDATTIGEFLAKLTPEPLPLEIRALLVVQAAMIPDDTAPADLLSWVTWDEYRRPLPGPVRETAAPPRRSGPVVTQPCGTYAAYQRHKTRGELVDDDCQEAARAYWRERQRARKKKTKTKAPARQGPVLAPVTPAQAARHQADLERELRERKRGRRDAA